MLACEAVATQTDEPETAPVRMLRDIGVVTSRRRCRSFGTQYSELDGHVATKDGVLQNKGSQQKLVQQENSIDANKVYCDIAIGMQQISTGANKMACDTENVQSSGKHYDLGATSMDCNTINEAVVVQQSDVRLMKKCKHKKQPPAPREDSMELIANRVHEEFRERYQQLPEDPKLRKPKVDLLKRQMKERHEQLQRSSQWG